MDYLLFGLREEFVVTSGVTHFVQIPYITTHQQHTLRKVTHVLQVKAYRHFFMSAANHHLDIS